MVKVANLSADLTANTSTFDARIKKSRGILATTGRKMSRDADTFSKKTSLAFKRAGQSAAAFEGPLGGVAGRLSGLANIANTTGIAIGGTILAFAGLALGMKKGIQVADEYEGSMNRVEAILKATAGASGQSAEGIREFSNELAAGTLASVAGVEAAAAKLLTFRRITGDTFKRTLVLAQDLAATGFGSLSDNVTQLGKALEDPIRNLGALTRNGVSFTQAQQDVIKALFETGRAAEAQGIILDALAQQVGGAGAAEGGPIAKGLDLLSQRLDEFFLSLDKASGASGIFSTGLNNLNRNLERITGFIEPKDETFIEQLARETEQLNFMIEQTAEEIKERNKLVENQGRGEEIVQREILIQQLLVDGIKARIANEKEKALALAATAKAEQDKMSAEMISAKIAKARAAADKIVAKELERKAKLITDTTERLEREVVALTAQDEALKSNVVSIQDAATAREVLLEIQKLGIAEGSAEGEVLEFLIRKRNALKSIIQEEVNVRKRVTQIIQQNKTEIQLLNEELAEFNRLREQGRLTETQFQQAVDRTNEKIEDLDESTQNLKKAIDSVSNASQDAFFDMITGANSASDAVRQLGLELAKTVFKEATGDLFKTGTKSLFSGLGSIFGGFFQNGGRPPIGKASFVGEAGPELFVPDSAGTIIPNDQLMNGGGGPTIFADMRGASVEAVARLEAFVAELNGSIEPRAINAVAEERQRSPALFGGAA